MVKKISTEIKDFITEYKKLCVMTLGLAIVAFTAKTLCGRAVSWLQKTFGTTTKVKKVSSEILKPNPKLQQEKEEASITPSEQIWMSQNSKDSPNQKYPFHPLYEASKDRIILQQVDSVQEIDIQKKREQAVAEMGNLEIKLRNTPLQDLSRELKNLIQTSSDSLFPEKVATEIDVRHPSIKKVIFLISYNVHLNKFAVSLVGERKSRSEKEEKKALMETLFKGKDASADILQYKITNTATSHSFQMQQKLLREGYGSGLSSLRTLSTTSNKTDEVMSKNKDSAFLLEYGTEYLVELPEDFNIKPFNLQITL